MANKQTKSHIYTVWEKNNINLKKSLIRYMMKYYDCNREATFKTLDRLGHQAVKLNMNDVEAMTAMLQILTKNPPSEQGNNSQRRLSDRKAMIAELIGDMEVNTYLDYGCGDGAITKEVRDAFNLPFENVFGVDVLCQEKIAKNKNFSEFQYIHGHDFQSGDLKVNLVTAFMVLHHIPDVIGVLKKIYETVIPGGMLIIREHNFDDTPAMRSFLQLIHVFNDLKIDGTCNIKVLEDETTYRSDDTWGPMITSIGFEFVKETTYAENNPQGIYHASFRKPKKE